jgi:hypothetical protein
MGISHCDNPTRFTTGCPNQVDTPTAKKPPNPVSRLAIVSTIIFDLNVIVGKHLWRVVTQIEVTFG